LLRRLLLLLSDLLRKCYHVAAMIIVLTLRHEFVRVASANGDLVVSVTHDVHVVRAVLRLCSSDDGRDAPPVHTP
jgi:hypothetical protein